ncbi:6-phosphogluconolactonase [soil metagenome]
MIAERRTFPDREALAASLAEDVAARLAAAIMSKDSAVLAVSGGTTPKRFLAALSLTQVAWHKVTVTLVDERWVPETSERSNARLVRETLLVHDAAAAKFVPLFENEAEARSLPPFDAVILGMGNDGHTASFFPGGDTLAAALEPDTSGRILTMAAPGAGEKRLTVSLAAILESPFIALHIEGEEKMRAFDRAMQDGPVEEMPVRAILRGPRMVTIYWSP